MWKSEEIISGIQTAAYDILREVLTAAVPQLVQENEILKSMLTNLSKQVSDLQRETYEMKVAKPIAFPDIFNQGILLQKLSPLPTETPSNAFVIDVKGDTSQPASKQVHQMDVKLLNFQIKNGQALKKIQTTNKIIPNGNFSCTPKSISGKSL